MIIINDNDNQWLILFRPWVSLFPLTYLYLYTYQLLLTAGWLCAFVESAVRSAHSLLLAGQVHSCLISVFFNPPTPPPSPPLPYALFFGRHTTRTLTLNSFIFLTSLIHPPYFSRYGSLIPELFVGTATVTDPNPKLDLNSGLDSNANSTSGIDSDNSISASVSVSMVHLADALLVNALQVTTLSYLILTHL